MNSGSTPVSEALLPAFTEGKDGLSAPVFWTRCDGISRSAASPPPAARTRRRCSGSRACSQSDRVVAYGFSLLSHNSEEFAQLSQFRSSRLFLNRLQEGLLKSPATRPASFGGFPQNCPHSIEELPEERTPRWGVGGGVSVGW